MRIIIIILLPVLVLANFSSCLGDSDVECVDIRLAPIAAYDGWPFQLPCDLIDDDVYHYHYDADFAEANTLCVIRNGEGKIVFNKSVDFSGEGENGFLIPDLSPGTHYQLIVMEQINDNQERCFKTEVRFNVTSLPKMTCGDYVNSRLNTITTSDLGGSSELICELDPDERPTIDTDNVIYQWHHNCSDQPIGSDKKLFIKWNNLNQVGSYVCSVTYKGMTRFVIQHHITLNRPLSFGPPTLTCSSAQIAVERGGKAVFNCEANFGTGRLEDLQFNIQWAKSSESIDSFVDCSSSYDGREDVFCSYDNPNDDSISTPDDRPAIVNIIFTFKNVDEKNYGNYSLIVTKDNAFTTNVTLLLSPDHTRSLLSTATVAGICIGVIVFLIIMMSFFLHQLLYIRVYFKRHFGAVILDEKSYGASLLYNFTRVNDIFVQEDLRSSVTEVRDILEELGFRIYDERKDGWIKPSRAENIQMMIEESHRVVVFLTSDFIKDGWSMMSLKEGFHEMIYSRSKFIFILLPGIKEYLQQHSKDDDSCRLIQRAMKLNYAIEWPKSRKLNRRKFLFQLEDGMPKLPPPSLLSVCSLTDSDKIINKRLKSLAFSKC